MTMNYEKTLEVMNDLESAFSNISTLEMLVNYISDALKEESMTKAKTGVSALRSYLYVFTDQYDTASKRAWNNTVLACRTADKYHGTEYYGSSIYGSSDEELSDSIDLYTSEG